MQKHNGFAESIKERASMLLSMKESVSASSEQTMPGVAKVLSALMIPPSMSLSMDRISVGNGIRNGTIKLINSSASENVVLKPVSSSVLQTSVPNIRVLSKTNVGASSLLSDNVVQSPVNVTKEILSKRVVKRSKDVGIVGIIDVPPKRIKMLTVAKRVPLINTVGNQSKLTPFSPSQYQASFETVNAQSNDIQKSQSILEARLTSPASILANAVNVHAKSSKENGGSLHKMPPCTSTSDKSDINASGNSQRFLVNGQSKSGSDALKTFVPPRNLVLEFEKGVTRLAAVEPRTVTMVDVSTQVYMQESEEQYVKDLPIQSSTLHANTAELSGSSQPAAVKFVLVDTKDGKRMLAIPKQIISNYSGPKTFVIEGKAVKKEAEEPLELASTGSSKESSGEFWAAANTKCQPDTVPQIGASLTASCQNPAKVENIQNTLSNLLLGGSIPNVSTVVSRLSTETLTTSSCKKQSFQVRADTLSRKSDFPLFPVSLSGGNGVLARTVLEPNAISNTNTVVSDSLTLPLNTFNKLNGPFKNDSLYRSSSSLSQENFKSSNTPAEAFPNSLNSRPFVQAQPNASHVYVVVSNQGTKDPFCHQGVQNNFAQHVESKTIRKRNTSASDVSLSSNVWVKLPQASNSSLEIASGTRVTLSHKRLLNCGTKQIRAEVAGQELTQQCLDSGVSGKHEMRLDENSGSPMDSTDDSRGSGPLKENVNEDIEKYVRSAFADFRNCLVVNQGKLPIHEAVETNDYIALKRQCIVLRSRKVTVNILNSKEETPLQLALYHGHSSLVPLLLEYGADATVLDCDGNTTLHLAVRYAEDIVQVLLESGQIDKKLLNCFNDEGFTALHLASQDEKLEIISLLVKHGSDVNLPDGKSGRSALFHAVERKHYKAQKLLVSLGADSREANYSGSTPNHVTRVDAIAQLAGATAEDTIAEEISIETLLKSSSHH